MNIFMMTEDGLPEIFLSAGPLLPSVGQTRHLGSDVPRQQSGKETCDDNTGNCCKTLEPL